MMILNLDKKFKPILGEEIQHETFFFSGGEPHIKINPIIDTDKVFITHRINSFNDLGILLVAVDALRRLGIKKMELLLPYFPAARQDRVMVNGEPLTVKVYADIINNMQLDKVTIIDPHSEVTSALLNDCNIINNHEFISKVTQQLPKKLLLVAPDAGAVKKIHKLARHLKDYEVLECAKSRDLKTGALSGFKVPIDDLKQNACLIVDDICDGGGTFLGLAKELKNCNAGDLYLAVSHGIFSKGLKTLQDNFKTIFTTDSIKQYDSNEVNQIQIKEIISYEI